VLESKLSRRAGIESVDLPDSFVETPAAAMNMVFTVVSLKLVFRPVQDESASGDAIGITADNAAEKKACLRIFFK
jgi:hypothetical protein